MKRWLVLILTVVIAVVATVIVRQRIKADAQKKRAAAYEAALQQYTRNFPAGLSRKEVENSLRARGIAFGQLCCVHEQSAYADLIRVGRDPICGNLPRDIDAASPPEADWPAQAAPWFCSENNVHVAIEFASATGLRTPRRSRDDDVLKRVRLFHHLEGCL